MSAAYAPRARWKDAPPPPPPQADPKDADAFAAAIITAAQLARRLGFVLVLTPEGEAP